MQFVAKGSRHVNANSDPSMQELSDKSCRGVSAMQMSTMRSVDVPKSLKASLEFKLRAYVPQPILTP